MATPRIDQQSNIQKLYPHYQPTGDLSFTPPVYVTQLPVRVHPPLKKFKNSNEFTIDSDEYSPGVAPLSANPNSRYGGKVPAIEKLDFLSYAKPIGPKISSNYESSDDQLAPPTLADNYETNGYDQQSPPGVSDTYNGNLDQPPTYEQPNPTTQVSPVEYGQHQKPSEDESPTGYQPQPDPYVLPDVEMFQVLSMLTNRIPVPRSGYQPSTNGQISGYSSENGQVSPSSGYGQPLNNVNNGPKPYTEQANGDQPNYEYRDNGQQPSSESSSQNQVSPLARYRQPLANGNYGQKPYAEQVNGDQPYYENQYNGQRPSSEPPSPHSSVYRGQFNNDRYTATPSQPTYNNYESNPPNGYQPEAPQSVINNQYSEITPNGDQPQPGYGQSVGQNQPSTMAHKKMYVLVPSVSADSATAESNSQIKKSNPMVSNQERSKPKASKPLPPQTIATISGSDPKFPGLSISAEVQLIDTA